MNLPFYWSIGIIAVLSLWIILIKRSESRLKHSIRCYAEQVKEMRDQQFEIRAQKHDLLNHVNTINALVSMQEYADLLEYTERWANDVTYTFEKYELGHPVLTALLQTKQADAETRGVLFMFQFENWRLIPAHLSPLELVRLFGNLIDNAIEYAACRDQHDRWVRVHGNMKNDKLLVRVINPGKLPKCVSRNMLKQGYTTKHDHGGIGLPIVQEIAARLGGRLQYQNKGGQITFKLEIPLL
ncbi:sensor histidine kinase [Cohnella panacarvi]|uniref:sensor histidine kinase n=1 Tax=Cohnella panacarvi TaxID=400776 RepID=UPI00047C49F8|nr:GHKL domain-containing protein [Cohnella panacarvi]